MLKKVYVKRKWHQFKKIGGGDVARFFETGKKSTGVVLLFFRFFLRLHYTQILKEDKQGDSSFAILFVTE